MDKDSAKKAIQHFKYAAHPTNPSGTATATVKDIEKLISEISKLATALVNSMDD